MEVTEIIPQSDPVVYHQELTGFKGNEPKGSQEPGVNDKVTSGENPVDQVNLSPEGIQLSRSTLIGSTEDSGYEDSSEKEETAQKSGALSEDQTGVSGQPLSDEEKEQVEKLRQRDQEVRSHEMAHLAVAGQFSSGGIRYELTTGPDGRQYAVGGQVSIRIPDAPTPEEDLSIATQVERAALAPANPSPADRSIAASARQKGAEAMQEITQKALDRHKHVELPADASETAFPRVDETENEEKKPGSSTEEGKTIPGYIPQVYENSRQLSPQSQEKGRDSVGNAGSDGSHPYKIDQFDGIGTRVENL